MARAKTLIALSRADVEQACRQRARELAPSLGMSVPDVLSFEQRGKVSFQDREENVVPLEGVIVAWEDR